MTPGPTLIVKPPGCTTPLKIRTLGSGNTSGAVRWTDSKCEAPHLPDQPWLKKHPLEHVLFWSDECERIDSIANFWKPDPKNELWQDLAIAEVPTEQDYFSALDAGMGDTPQKLRYLRTRLWWVGNDPIRQSPVHTLPPPHLDNLARLALVLSDDDPQQRLLKAEVFRELGFFKDALALLESDSFGELQENAMFIALRCRAEEPQVARFPW